MLCPNCRYHYEEEDIYCRHCGEDLTITPTSVVTTTQTRLPALLNPAQLPRKVAASVGAVALGVGIELLRRGLVARLVPVARVASSSLPVLGGVKDILPSQSERSLKVPKGYVIDETIVIRRRVIRRER
ncbi:MAG: zinc ribbon domain-containing protein [Chloroflexota bacterium]|nr:zinc ribbon domain-containing protein [Chloroflexota bacterium]